MKQAICFLLIFLNSQILFAQSFANKKTIYCGHHVPTPEQYLEQIDMVSKLPFSGYSIYLTANQAGSIAANNSQPGRKMWSNIEWKEEWFQESADKLKQANAKLKREIFLITNCNGNTNSKDENNPEVDWFDDAGWKQVVEHYRIMAKWAKQSGCKGIIFDGEPYPHNKLVIPFCYERQPLKGQHSYAQYYEKAVQRGQEMMQAMTKEFPDITIISYFYYSYLLNSRAHRGPDLLDNDDPVAAAKTHHYNLMAPMIIGWLKTCPDTIKLVDGNEDAYYYTNDDEYKSVAFTIREQALKLIPKELHAKYSKIMQVGSTVFPDNCNPKSTYKEDIEKYSPLQTYRQRLSWAMQFTDEYVWIYAEQGTFLPNNKKKNPPTWEELLPGITQITEQTMQPQKIDRLQRSLSDAIQGKRAIQLLQNVDMKLKDKAKDWPANWFLWQPEWSQGEVAYQNQKVVISKTTGGLASQEVPVKPGELIHVLAEVEQQGEGTPFVGISFLEESRKQVKTRNNIFQVSYREKDGKKFVHGEFIAPDKAAIGRVHAGIHGQGGKDNRLTIHKIEAYRIDDPKSK